MANQSNTVKEIKKISRDELKAMGFQIAKIRKPVDLVNTGNVKDDAAKNGKRLAKRMLGDAIKAYKRLYRLADGSVNRNKTEYPVSLSEQQINYMEAKLAALHQSVFEALHAGRRPVADVEEFPD